MKGMQRGLLGEYLLWLLRVFVAVVWKPFPWSLQLCPLPLVCIWAMRLQLAL